jgi:hypothetical protein
MELEPNYRVVLKQDAVAKSVRDKELARFWYDCLLGRYLEEVYLHSLLCLSALGKNVNDN